jgi:hypothetical protein
MQINDLYVPPHRRLEIASQSTRHREQMELKTTIMLYDTHQHHTDVSTLIDSGCTMSAIDKSFVEKHRINTIPIANPMPVYNADGTRNQHGDITEFVELNLDIKGHRERISLMVTQLRSHTIFLGMEWLQRHNPDINWITRHLEFTRCPKDCGKEFEPVIGTDERLYYLDTNSWMTQRANHIRASSNISTDLAAAAEATKERRSWQEVIPPCYHSYERVFTKDSFDSLPPRRPWDHAIDLTPDAKPVDCKIYPLALDEQKELDDFLEEHLASGRIRPSKSPMASPFFFGRVARRANLYQVGCPLGIQ